MLFAWGILLKFSPHDDALRDLTVQDLKAMFELIWRTFRESATGLPMSVVRTIFEPFGACIDWDSLPPVVSVRAHRRVYL